MNSNDPNRPCPFCTEPVGFGAHEEYCPKNPVNLERTCSRAGDGMCNGPGNHVTDHGFSWVCDFHDDLELAMCRKNSAHGRVVYTEIRINTLEKELAGLKAQLPELKVEEVVSRQQFEDLFKKGA